MRDIIFRGKSKENGAWVYGTPVSTLELCHEYKHSKRIVMFPESSLVIASEPTEDWSARGIFMFNDDLPVEVIPETVGQFTGLLDKKRAKIFEGDILEIKHMGTWVICFCDGSFMALPQTADRLLTADEIADKAMIIGNIHDNPELGKEERK